MVRPVKTVNKTVCPDCDTEFTGKICPECGTTKNLKPMASDGIPKEMHKDDVVFGNVAQLSTSSELLDDDAELLKERAEYQKAETKDNLREALVLRSQIKNMDLKKQMIQKQIELDRYAVDPVMGPAKDWPIAVPANQQQPGQEQQSPQSLFGPASPQATFMSQLMKMDKDKRGDFLEQLSDADPSAIQTMTGMFQQNPMMNPMSNPGMNQMGMYGQMPPWMNPMYMQQQQQPQEQGQDPMVSAVDMMATMFQMFQQMQPKQDTAANDKMVEFKNSLEKLNDKLDSRMSEKNHAADDSLRSEIHEIKARLSHEQKPQSFSDNVKNMKEIISDLDTMGLINQGGSQDTSIDDKLKLQHANHTIDMENKRFELEKDKVNTDEISANAKQDIVSAMIKGRMQKRFSNTVNDAQQQPSQSQTPIQRVRPPVQRQKPKEVFSEVHTESGVIQETRKPIVTE